MRTRRWFQKCLQAASLALFLAMVFASPAATAQSSAHGGKSYNLLRWLELQLKKSARSPGREIPDYDRRLHFGGWINEDAPADCYDTRAESLIRDHRAATPVIFYVDKPCQVRAGEWQDPYTGRTFKTSASLQIDHVVPLKNAYYTGAWRWTRPQRCHYANFMGNDYHLLSVHGHENMSKNSGDPSEYLPPNKKYLCEYVRIWMKIKLIWNLEVTESETEGIRHAMQLGRCDPNGQVISAAELRQQRARAAAVSEKCLQQRMPVPTPELRWLWDGQDYFSVRPGTPLRPVPAAQ